MSQDKKQPRKQVSADERRTRLLAAAPRVMKREGIAAATPRTICAKAGGPTARSTTVSAPRKSSTPPCSPATSRSPPTPSGPTSPRARARRTTSARCSWPTGHRSRATRTRNRLLTWWHTAKILVTGLTESPALDQYRAFNSVHRDLRRSTTAPLTDELTLFAVDASTRGSGVGKSLYRDHMDHLAGQGRESFYLYTGFLCTYAFYERQGMTRAASKDMRIRLDGEPENLGVYLYSGRVR